MHHRELRDTHAKAETYVHTYARMDDKPAHVPIRMPSSLTFTYVPMLAAIIHDQRPCVCPYRASKEGPTRGALYRATYVSARAARYTEQRM